MSGHQGKSAEVFDRLGLHRRGRWRSFAGPEERDGPRPAARLRDALEELGGIHAAFARFLGWRADVLDAESLRELRRLRYVAPPLPIERLKEVAERELGPRSEELIRHLDPEPAWVTISRTAWRTTWKGLPVVVQIAADALSDSDLLRFEQSMRYLNHPELAAVNTPQLLAEFRTWLRQCESLAQERRYLLAIGAEALETKGQPTLVAYPKLIEEISTPDLLVWPWVEGEPAAEAIARGSIHAVLQIAITVLEQLCSLSLVDGELDLDSMVITNEYRLAIRRLNRPVAVPPTLANTGTKYIASVLAGESTLVVQSLVPLSGVVSSAGREKRMLNALSSVEPELKIHMWYPASAAAFESNWKALARLQPERPLFLDMLHRNLVAVGYWNADAVIAGAPREDVIEEAEGPVVDTLFRGQIPGLTDPKVLTEWGVGAGLFLFGAMRESARLAEELRDNNLTVGVETPETEEALSGVEIRDAPKVRRASARHGVALALLLTVMLVALRYGSHAAGAVSPLLSVLILGAAGGLFWVVSKIG